MSLISGTHPLGHHITQTNHGIHGIGKCGLLPHNIGITMIVLL